MLSVVLCSFPENNKKYNQLPTERIFYQIRELKDFPIREEFNGLKTISHRNLPRVGAFNSFCSVVSFFSPVLRLVFVPLVLRQLIAFGCGGFVFINLIIQRPLFVLNLENWPPDGLFSDVARGTKYQKKRQMHAAYLPVFRERSTYNAWQKVRPSGHAQVHPYFKAQTHTPRRGHH